MEDIKRYEKLNKKATCISRQLTEEEKIKYGLEERNEINIELTIDEQFENLLPPLSQEEFNKLEELILKDGCTESIKVWTDSITNITYIVDGHNRYNICTKHNIHFRTESKGFNSRYEVIDWIINFQFGRRNLSNEEKYYLTGLQYENEKKKSTDNLKQNKLKDENSSGKSYRSEEDVKNSEQFQSIKTAERIAEQHGVSEKSIRDNGKYAIVVNEITELVGVEAKNKILTGEKKISKEDVIELGKQIKNGDIDKTWLKEQFIDSDDKKVKITKKEDAEKKIGRPPKIDNTKPIETIQPSPNNVPIIKYETKKCLKCNESKDLSEFDNMDFCKDCMKNINAPKEKIDNYVKYNKDGNEIIKDLKTEKIVIDYLVVANELLSIKSSIQEQIRIAYDKIFNRYNLPEKMSNEDKNNFENYMNEIVEDINNLKNKIKGEK